MTKLQNKALSYNYILTYNKNNYKIKSYNLIKFNVEVGAWKKVYKNLSYYKLNKILS